MVRYIYLLDIRDYGAIILRSPSNDIITGDRRSTAYERNLHFEKNRTMGKYGNITEMMKTKIKFPFYGEKTSCKTM